jgi:hypothetical protein
MTNLLLLALVFTGCVDDATPTEPHRTIQIDERVIAEGYTSEAVELCSTVVATEGPCAVACDPEAVMEFVRPGTCMLFVCRLEDDTGAINLGGCKP